MKKKTIRPKKCRACKELFTPFSSLAKACSVACSLKIINDEKIKDFNRETRRLKSAIKSRGDWLKETQQVFNKFIRLRDETLPCISCGRIHSGQYHAGHYKTVGANPELRFNEHNCHKQCAPCNNHLSGNIANYRPNLIAKIGLDCVSKLEGPNAPKHYTIEDLKELKKVYQDKIKAIEGKL
jgi:hypothetical protein